MLGRLTAGGRTGDRLGPRIVPRLTLVAAGLVIGIAVGGVIWLGKGDTKVVTSSALHRATPLDGSNHNTIPAQLGQDIWTTWASGSFNPLSEVVVHVTSVKLDGGAPGIRVLEVLACNFREGAGTADLGLVGDYFAQAHKRSACHPPNRAFFVPGKRSQDWYFLAHLRASRSGSFDFPRWRMIYREGKKRGVQTYTGRVTINVSEATTPAHAAA